MNIVSLIQPSELGSNFRLESGVWHVNFPTTATPPPPISNDARNIIKNTADGMFVDARDRLAYALVQDNTDQKIRLYSHPQGTPFDIATATLASEIDMLAMNGQFDDIAIEDGIITFTDAQTGLTLTLNTNELQRVGNLVGSDSVRISESAGVMTVYAKINPQEDNLLEVTPGGLRVSTDRIDTIFGDKLATADIHVQSMARNYDGISHVIGDQITVIPKVALANSAGNVIALVNEPGALEMSNPYEYPTIVRLNNSEVVGDTTTNNTTAHFSMTVNGQLFFASKPDLLSENLSINPNTNFQIYANSEGVIEIRSDVDMGDFTPIHVVLSPSTEQRRYTTRFLDLYRGAKVLPNGDFEFTLIPHLAE